MNPSHQWLDAMELTERRYRLMLRQVTFHAEHPEVRLRMPYETVSGQYEADWDGPEGKPGEHGRLTAETKDVFLDRLEDAFPVPDAEADWDESDGR
jgi:hypothetical protein